MVLPVKGQGHRLVRLPIGCSSLSLKADGRPYAEADGITCRTVVAAAVEREGAPPQQLRLRQQQHMTRDPKGPKGVAAVAMRRVHRVHVHVLPVRPFLDLFLDPDRGPSPFRVNSAFPACLCCS